MQNAKITSLVTVLALVGLLAGCGDDDPTSPNGGTTVAADDAEEFAGAALEMINAMTLDIPELASGNMKAAGARKNYGEPEWDAEQMAWVYDYVTDFSEGDPPTSYGQFRISMWIQFRNDDGPLPSSLGATVMEYRVSDGMTMHGESDEGTVDMDYDLATTMIVSYVEGGYNADGTGISSIDATFSNGTRTERMDVTMTWGMDLMLPFDGCPTGTAEVTIGGFSLDAVYNGTSTMSWSMVGPNYSAQGTEQLYCGMPQ